jgi:hypothetical protein
MKKTTILCSLLFSAFIFSQVGINTANPQGAFTVDGAKDNPLTGTPSAAQQTNDFTVTTTGSVGVGTNAPDASSALEIRSANKGFLPPKLTLTSDTDAVTISNPATGLTVYHFGITGLEAGLYTNTGTPTAPKWTKGSQSVTNIEGSKVYKSVYRGRNVSPYDTTVRPNVVVPEMNLMFRFAVDAGGVMRLQTRLINTPSATVTVRLLGHWQGNAADQHGSYANTLSFTSANYTTWSNFGGGWSGEWGYYYLIYSDEVRTGANNPYERAMNLYGIDSYGFYGTSAAAISKELYSLAGEVF